MYLIVLHPTNGHLSNVSKSKKHKNAFHCGLGAEGVNGSDRNTLIAENSPLFRLSGQLPYRQPHHFPQPERESQASPAPGWFRQEKSPTLKQGVGNWIHLTLNFISDKEGMEYFYDCMFLSIQ
jgi:hypothetical protein